MATTKKKSFVEIERYEVYFMVASLLVLAGAIAAIFWALVAHHAELPEPAGRIEDISLVAETAPFDDPGVHQTGDNTYDVVLLARTWSWSPTDIELPAGSEVTFVVTSADVVHGMRIPDTNVNAMVIPGQITEVTVTFDEPRTFTLLCHEYCGIGHHQMGTIIRIV